MIARFYFNQERATRWRLLGAVALACLAMLYRFHLGSVADSTWIIENAGYWLVAATAVLFAVILGREIRAHWPGWRALRPHWPGLLTGLLIASFWQVHEPHDFKVLFDEHVLGGIARTMHFERLGAYAGYAHYANGHLTTLGLGVDKRPLMYPFLVSIIHDLTGFRPENSFVVNGLLGFVLLMLMYGLGARLGGRAVGCFGQWLLAGLPLLAQNATGGGFDLLNITALTGFLLAAWYYWRQPGEGGMDLLVFSGLFLANCRYESMLFLGVVALLVLLKWVRERRITLTLVSALSPPLALPPLLINQIFMGGGGGSYFQTAPGNFLNVKYIPENFEHAAYFLFTPDWHANNSVLLSAVGIIALLLTSLWILRRLFIFARERGVEIPLLFTVFGVLVITGISWLSFWGHWDDGLVQRFSLPLYMAFAWCAMFAATTFMHGRPLPTWAVGAAALYAVAAAAPVSSEAYVTNDFQTYLTYKWARDYVLKHADESVLIVSRASVMFTLYGQANIHMGIANHDPKKVFNVVPLGLYRKVWVVQEYTLNAKLNAWVEYPPARLDQRLILKTIAEYDSNMSCHVRISEVVGYDPAKPAGVRRLKGEMDAATTEKTRADLGGDYVPPAGSETANILTARPADEPPAFPMFTELPGDAQSFADYLSHQYP
ncbi:MAG TPA: glycosyltransferase family 39 protein [Opitutales bacterium]|nr:glycosyltransferase family 39 protein [Opitutales bacterium]